MTQGTQDTRLLGYLWLQPGLSKMNGYTLLWACLTGIPFLVVINFIQPYILSAMLDVPMEQQGSVSARLAVLHEFIMIALTGPAGALADRIGRRRVLTAGYIIAAVGLAVYPWADSVNGMIMIRVVYAIGAALLVSGYSVLIADYPQEKSRGRLVAIGGVLNGLGILMLAAIGGNLPKWLVDAGYGAIDAGRLAMLLLGIAFAVAGVFVYFGFKGGDRGIHNEAKPPLLELLKKGFGAARNPRIAIAYASAFAARGDVVVIGTYVSLWGTQVGIKGGLSGADALQQAMIIFAVIQSVALLASPVIGILNDRINRVTALILGMGLAALGYLAFGLHDNPFGGTGIGVAVLLGFGQIAAILAGTTLVGQEADPKITGATIGVWSFCGAVGTLIGSYFGGILFDLWTPGAPFLLMGILNLLVMIAAIWVRIRFPGDGQLRSEEAGEFIAPIRDD